MNAVIYARYSSISQTEQSIEGQLRDCHAYAQREDLTIIHEYIDRALSGRSDDRPDFQQMIADSAKKQFQYVIVWKLDRFARDRYDSAIYKRKLKINGVKVLSAAENIGDGDESIILEAVLEASAEYYSRDLSKKTKRGLRESALKGQFISSRTPLGYKVEDKKLKIDVDTAPIMRKVFLDYADGKSKTQIALELNEAGYRTLAGKPFSAANFQAGLHNQVYIGKIVYKQYGIVMDCDPLIDQEIFRRVQERLEEKRRAPAKAKAAETYQLQGKIFCGLCGASITGESGRGNGGVYAYYTCSKRKKRNACTKALERKDFLEWYITKKTVDYVLQPKMIRQISKAVYQKYKADLGEDKSKDIEKEITKTERQILKYVEIIAESTSRSVRAGLDVKICQLEDRKAALELELAKLRIAAETIISEADIQTWLCSFCDGDPLNLSFRERMIDTFINSVFLFDDKIVVYYNVRSNKQVTYSDMLKNTSEPEFTLEKSELVRISDDQGRLAGVEPATL